MRNPWNFARWKLEDQLAPAKYVARWTVLVAPGAVAIGSAVALFLWALERVTTYRWGHPQLLWLLPLAGAAVGAMYLLLGRGAEAGNNLIVDEIHEPGGGVPARMAPLVLVGTVVTHLFGGSAGREGTAVQIGGAIASTLTRWFRLDPEDTSILLTTGIAAGFGAVFGTPITGGVFALEVLSIGRISYRALLPCLMASLIGDATVRAWGIHHTMYRVAPLVATGLGRVDGLLMLKVAIAAVAFGLVGMLFAEATHGVASTFKRLVRHAVLRPVIGGAIVIALAFTLGTRDYLGLGVAGPDSHAVTLVSSFAPGGANPASWLWKLVFTAITLGSGFKGGEVTPLFFIGATLGNVLATVMHAPVDLFAALGFVAVFAGATNTPIACTLMGIELFGADAAVYIATASFLAYMFSGHSGIYAAQRIATPKADAQVPPEPALSLAVLHERQRARKPRRTRAHLTQADNDSGATGTSAPFPTLHIIGDPLLSNHSIGNPNTGAVHASHVTHATHSYHPHVLHRAHPIVPHAIGQVRVYLKPTDHRHTDGFFKRLFGRRLAHDIVVAAKAAGLPHALVLHTRFGYTGGGPIASDHPEYGIHALPLCVELMGEPHRVEAFCRDHADLLVGRLVVYRHAERWEMITPPAAEVGEGDNVAIA